MNTGEIRSSGMNIVSGHYKYKYLRAEMENWSQFTKKFVSRDAAIKSFLEHLLYIGC